MKLHRNAERGSALDMLPKNRNTRRGLRSLVAIMGIGALALLPVAGANASSATSMTQAPTLKVALTGDIDSLNPFLAVLSQGTAIMTFQYESLVQFSAETSEIVPGIADSWSVSEDGKAWTFKLPADAKWSDGEAITSADVKWTFDAVMEQDALKMANGSLVENFVSVEAPDDSTVVINLKSAQAPNPGSEFPIVPEHVWAALPDPAAFDNAEDAVGSGPFIVKKYDKTSGVQLITNENYRHGAAQVAGVTYVPYKNGDAAVQALKTGEVDIVSGLTPAQYQALQSVDGITTNAGEGKRYSAVAINPGAKDVTGADLGDGNPVLQDKVVRQAIVRAIDNKTIVEKVKQGLGSTATGEVPLTSPLYHWNATEEELTLSFDPDAANKMLDDAGYTKGSDGIRLDKDGKKISLRLMGRSTDPTHQQMADFIKPWLKDIGIEVAVEMKSPAQVNDESVLGQYDLYFTGWGIGPDPDFQLSINQCSSRPNADGTGATSESNWCDPEFDKLYTAQHAELDPAKRAELVIEAQKLVYEGAANNVMYYGKALEAYRSDRFTDFVKQPTEGGIIMDQSGPWGLYSATPVSTDVQSQNSDSNGTIWWIVGGGVIVVGAIVTVLVRRKSSNADDQE